MEDDDDMDDGRGNTIETSASLISRDIEEQDDSERVSEIIHIQSDKDNK